MSKPFSIGVKIFKQNSPESLEQDINTHLKKFENNPIHTTANIQYAIAEETVLDSNGVSKKELIYSALVQITVRA